MPTSKPIAVLIGLSWLLAGCGSIAPAPYKGVLSLSWTIHGQAVSDAVCAGIDHLVITVESTPSVGVAIAPVACHEGAGWERDDVPEGSDTILIDAVAPTGQTTFEGISKIGVTDSHAGTPTALDLQPL